ncbi:DUF418 domain-containing protein [Sphingomonas koreensis]
MNSTPDSGSSRPRAPRSRIDELDILRGIAILGIFFINIPFMALGSSGYSSAEAAPEGAAGLIMQFLLEGTQRGILQLLFGAGMLLLTSSIMAPDGPVSVADRYFRRNLWLLAFGLLHVFVLLWPYDILHVYAIAALFLFPFRTLRPQTALGLGLCFALFTLVAAVLDAPGVLAESSYGPRSGSGIPSAAGGYAPFAQIMIASWFEEVGGMGLAMGVAEAFSAMLIGIALFKWGVIQGQRSARLYFLLGASAYVVGLGLRLLEHTDASLGPLAASGFGEFARLAITVGHIALVNLLLKCGLGARILWPLKATGQTAFSLYLMQSMIGIWLLFSPWGIAAGKDLQPDELTAIAAFVVALQIAIANVWLRFFSNGPVEWAWRRLTELHGGSARESSAARMDGRPGSKAIQ